MSLRPPAEPPAVGRPLVARRLLVIGRDPGVTAVIAVGLRPRFETETGITGAEALADFGEVPAEGFTSALVVQQTEGFGGYGFWSEIVLDQFRNGALGTFVLSDTGAMLRARLLALRDDLRQRLADAAALDGGLLRVLADVETVIAGLDRDV